MNEKKNPSSLAHLHRLKYCFLGHPTSIQCKRFIFQCDPRSMYLCSVLQIFHELFASHFGVLNAESSHAAAKWPHDLCYPCSSPAMRFVWMFFFLFKCQCLFYFCDLFSWRVKWAKCCTFPNRPSFFLLLSTSASSTTIMNKISPIYSFCLRVCSVVCETTLVCQFWGACGQPSLFDTHTKWGGDGF